MYHPRLLAGPDPVQITGFTSFFLYSKPGKQLQNRTVETRLNMARPGRPAPANPAIPRRPLTEIEEFRYVQQRFKDDLPAVLANLREDNAGYLAK